MSRPEDERGFLSRWSARKRAVDAEDAARATDAEQPLVSAESAENDAAELPLPSLDDVLPGSDVSAFFARHVPMALRNAALRKTWATDPVISSFIEMAENQYDFNNPASIPGFAESIGTFDAERLVDALFRGPVAEDPQVSLPPPKVAEDAQAMPTESGGDVEDMRETTDIAAEIGPDSANDLTGPPENVALQKMKDESNIYDFGRRRHGGAVPT